MNLYVLIFSLMHISAEINLGLKIDQGRLRRHPDRTDLELFPQLGGITLGVDSQHLFVGDCKLVHQDGRLSTQAGLQNGVMDKNILLLKAQQAT